VSLAIAFKGAEGIVLAADSRATLNATLQQPNGQILVMPSTFDNATKLLRVKGQDYAGAVTYGVGALGQQEPRTPSSLIPEFEADLVNRSVPRLSVENFSKELSDFFLKQWSGRMPTSIPQTEQMYFIVGGVDDGPEVYGRLFEFRIPGDPVPKEALVGQFGARWGGQSEFVNRLMNGFDPKAADLAAQALTLDSAQKSALEKKFTALAVAIPYQFLSLQDCVDLSIFLIRTTISIQRWIVGVRGVGGPIDVATITKTAGFTAIQEKSILGEKIL
jgi:hypothetical protein